MVYQALGDSVHDMFYILYYIIYIGFLSKHFVFCLKIFLKKNSELNLIKLEAQQIDQINSFVKKTYPKYALCLLHIDMIFLQWFKVKQTI